MKNFLSLFALAMIAYSAVSAQQLTNVTEIKQPGDVIRLEVKFDGADAGKVQQIIARLDRTSPALDNQANFSGYCQGGWVGDAPSHTFSVEIKIPDAIGTGEYRLTIIAQSPYGQTNYVAGQQFQTPLFHIRNPATFTPPNVHVTVIGTHP